jgi:MYXO-CTERM domain-containing protein
MCYAIGRFGRISTVAAIISPALLCAGTALATPPLVTMQWFASNDGVDPVTYYMHAESDEVIPGADGSWQFIGGTTGLNKTWLLGWDVAALPHPNGAGTSSGSAYVTANLAVTNNTASYQSFWALVTVALDEPITGATFMNGQASAAVTDSLGNGAEIRTITSGPFAGDPVYTGLIDGSPAHTLFDSPFSLTAGPFGSNSISATFGQPVPILGPEALTTISVWLKIELSPFDTANIVGTFEVAPVPGPAALPLLAAFGLAMGRRRRR